VLRSSTLNPVTLTQYNAIMDQYSCRGRRGSSISKVRGLTVTFGPRLEGVPARNLFPTGMTLASAVPDLRSPPNPASSTLSVATCSHSRSPAPSIATARKASRRSHRRSWRAAFANWVWLASYSFRAGGKHADSEPSAAHSAVPTHVDSAAVVGAAGALACRLSMIRGAACQGC